MWSISITSTQFANEKLASISVESPSNLHTSEGLGLLVGLWCGRLHDSIRTNEGSLLEFAVGFHAGDVVVDAKGGQISNKGRLQTTGGHLKVMQSDVDEATRHGEIGGQAGVDLTRWIGSLAKLDFAAIGKTNQTSSQSNKRTREYDQPFWRIADAGHNFWRVYGLGLNQENVLEHKIIGDEALCHILPELDVERIRVSVTFRCSLRDLWFQRTNASQLPVDIRFRREQDDINRAAVAARVAALAINRASFGKDSFATNADVTLARQTLQATRTRPGGPEHDRFTSN
ncbi:hypothetical protein ACJMQP_20650 [Rhodopseudomonas palustris]|jgi:hypothetical protein